MVNGEIRLEQVNSFTYCESNVRKDANCTHEVKSRLAMGHGGNDQVNENMEKQVHLHRYQVAIDESFGLASIDTLM